MPDSARILSEKRSLNARFVRYAADAGHTMSRWSCPKTQIWLLLKGKWSERRDEGRAAVGPTDVLVYAPKEPCRRTIESSSVAISIELVEASRVPVALSPAALQAIWHLASLPPNEVDALRLDEILLPLTSDAAPDLRGSVPSWLKQVRERLHADPGAPWDLHSLARQTGISPNHLSASFRQYFGMPISRYVRRLRIRAAYQISEIDGNPNGWAVAGFYDAAHFHRACRQEWGHAPREIGQALIVESP